MAALRKANAYSKRNVTPYTRWSKRKQKGYIKMIPPQKIVKFDMGKTSDFQHDKLPFILNVLCTEKVQIRNNALEACRQYINKQLTNALGDQYFFKVVPFPHHIQRENKMLTGAGADRMQTGMQLSFGKAMNKAAILKENSPLFIIATPNEKGIQIARTFVKKVKAKLPCLIKFEVVNLSKTKKE
jgi:large subunit ribosomal protein L10e